MSIARHLFLLLAFLALPAIVSAAGIVKSGDTVYMTWSSGGGDAAHVLVSIDVSDPAKPRELGRLVLDGPPQDLVLRENHAYLVTERGVCVIDISVPAAPKQLAALTLTDDPMRGPRGIALHGDTAVLACGRAGVALVDISQPTQPRLVHRADLPGFARGLDVDGSDLHVASDSAGLQRLRLTDDGGLKVLATEPAARGEPNRVIRLGQSSYLAAGSQLIMRVSPTGVDYHADRGILSPYYGAQSQDLDVLWIGDKSYICVADGESGLVIVAIRDAGAMRTVGLLLDGFGTGGNYQFTAIDVADTTAYIHDDLHGLRVVDLRDPTAPRLRASLSLSSQ